MKIAVLTSGILPIPSVQGGAVENLIDFYLEYNETHKIHDITIYSIYDKKVENHPAHASSVNHYFYIDTNSLWSKIKRKVYYYMHGEEYHNYFIEYYLEQSMKHIQKHHYDYIILENRPSYALKLRNVTNAKLIYHLHNEKLTLSTRSYQEIYDAASLIICVSDYISRSVKSINTHDTKCVTVHNGIDLYAFASSAYIARKNVGLCDDDFVIIYSGRINPEKGIMELTEAISRMTNYHNIKLLVIGSSFFGNVTIEDDFTKELRKKTEHIKDKIRFTGYIPYKDVPAYLKLADIAVVPSMWEEAFGLTVLEAMATGLPLITTRSGGIPEICEDVALIVDRSQIIENIIHSIELLYNNPNLRRKMSVNSLNRAKDFSKDKYTYLFFNAIESLNSSNN